MTSDTDDESDEDGAQVADIESILGLFKARGLPERMLRWHYRSRHQSLIAVSNHQFYRNELFIVPSPYTGQSGMGLRFHHIAHGVFDTGKTRTNAIEAAIVAEAVIAHARQTPHLSLGVVAFSAQQQRAIRDQLERLQREGTAEEGAFFQGHPKEPFFIKNLENVQGDERDVIFISVGYGPSSPGEKPPMRFGPVGQAGGERRLNVLISRAKQRCEIFSSMTDEDIDQEFARSRKGVLALKIFMRYARTGQMDAIENDRRCKEGDGLEAQVAETLRSRGYDVHRNVGIAGFFVDLAVLDRDRGDRYLLGIEFDGPSYRDARSARDRDRLRQQVLKEQGWELHRLWSLDWLQRPAEQMERIVAAIDDAQARRHRAQNGEGERRSCEISFVPASSLERDAAEEIDLASLDDAAFVASVAYEEAVLVRPPHCQSEIYATSIGVLTGLVERVVEIEGPVHIEEIGNRIRAAWGLKRTGVRIQESVETAASVAVRQGRLQRDGDFLSMPGAKPKIRDRSQVSSQSLRKPETLPPMEIHACVVSIVQANYGATVDQIVQSVVRAFGFKATGSQLRGVVEEVIEDAVRERVLLRQDAILTLAPGVDQVSDHTFSSDALLALVAEGEHEKLEFKQTLRWNVKEDALDKTLEWMVIKTVAAFANKEGGSLLIGVCDDGRIVGLGPDLATFGGSRDKMELYLTNLLGKL